MDGFPLLPQRACMAVPGGAVLFASVNGVHLETPSELQKQAAKQVRTECWLGCGGSTASEAGSGAAHG